ncbi:hypothetical protein [Rhodopila sp.]|uniref:hypothetical protein n=1 Tax=Rhodopila sp. TaxID=2480087 RepID=UPI003D1136D9
MSFAVGDRVRYNPQLLASALPQWRGTTWRIAALTGDIPGQGDRVFARLENHNGDIEDGVSTAKLVPDRNYPVRIDCPHCSIAGAQLLPKLGDRDDYDCPSCGKFNISGTQKVLFEEGIHDITRGQIVDEAGRRWLRPRPGTIMPIGFRLEPDCVICPLCHTIVAPRLEAAPRCGQCGGSYCAACLANGNPQLLCPDGHTDLTPCALQLLGVPAS